MQLAASTVPHVPKFPTKAMESSMMIVPAEDAVVYSRLVGVSFLPKELPKDPSRRFFK